MPQPFALGRSCLDVHPGGHAPRLTANARSAGDVAGVWAADELAAARYQGQHAAPASKRFRVRQRCRGMLTSTTRGGGYRLLSLLRRGHGGPLGPGRHLRPTSTPRRGWRWLTTTRSLTLLGLVGAAAIALSPFVTWTLPVEFGGLALTGTSVLALIRHAVRP
jgi:hypothetical protein